MTSDEQVKLIYRALQELTNDRCPFCEADISIEKFCTEYDVATWYDKQPESKSVCEDSGVEINRP